MWWCSPVALCFLSVGLSVRSSHLPAVAAMSDVVVASQPRSHAAAPPAPSLLPSASSHRPQRSALWSLLLPALVGELLSVDTIRGSRVCGRLEAVTPDGGSVSLTERTQRGDASAERERAHSPALLSSPSVCCALSIASRWRTPSSARKRWPWVRGWRAPRPGRRFRCTRSPRAPYVPAWAARSPRARGTASLRCSCPRAPSAASFLPMASPPSPHSSRGERGRARRGPRATSEGS